MANPRMTHRVDELHTQRATFGADSSIVFTRDYPHGFQNVGAPVKITGEMTVGLASAAEAPFGALERVYPDGSVVVAYHGAVEFKADAAAVSFGSAVVANGTGGVRDANSVASESGVGTVASEVVDGKVFVVI